MFSELQCQSTYMDVVDKHPYVPPIQLGPNAILLYITYWITEGRDRKERPGNE